MKARILRIFVLIVIYLGFDYQSYYYGLGKGIIAPKIPKEYILLFAGSDLGNQGVILKENVVGGVYLASKNSEIYLENNNKIFIKSFIGYYFNSKNIIIEIIDDVNNRKFIEINAEIGKSKYINYFFNEINKNEIITDNYDYINLNHSLKYFKRYKLINRGILIFILILIFSFLKAGFFKILKR